jgi:cytochrome c peroxidase
MHHRSPALRSCRRSAPLARAALLCLAAAPLALFDAAAQPAPAPASADPARGTAAGDAGVFLGRYLAFRSAQLASAAPDALTIPLGVVKGSSRSFSGAAGTLSIDLGSGGFSVALQGLSAGGEYAVRLVDQGEAPGQDRTLALATVRAAGPTATASGRLDRAALAGFEVDRAVVTRGDSTADVLATGSVSVFQKIFFRRLALGTEEGQALSFEDPSEAPALAPLVPDVEVDRAGAQAGAVPLDVLIQQGSRLFSTETFGGNGRTCATCHPPSNDFTIDPGFIAGLPPDDPLFVAEFVPELAQLERPRLMREWGLILENLDGLEDPANKFVMRSVPHTIGLGPSLPQDTSLTGGPAQMTGWSGDGAPGSGTLRDFATGAVAQHLTRSLARVPGTDFVPPTEQQLDALEAFQLSVGRDADPDLSTMSFLDPDVEAGKAIFVNGTGDPQAGGKCNACHANGGALNSSGENRNFDTNVEDMPHPAQALEAFPRDGGFGQAQAADGSFGDREFNTASVIEAADTPPFFHNNAAGTLEDVVRFYAGPEFNGPRAESGRFAFSEAQVAQLSNFMRALNVLQNIDVSRRELGKVLSLNGNPQPEVQQRLEAARLDTNDAFQVLAEGGVFPAAMEEASRARQLIGEAQAASGDAMRSSVEQAIARLDAARALIVAQ